MTKLDVTVKFQLDVEEYSVSDDIEDDKNIPADELTAELAREILQNNTDWPNEDVVVTVGAYSTKPFKVS